MDKQKFEMEYVVNCSPKMLYNRLSSASGLAEWFADDVSVNGKKFTFTWDGASQEAELVFKKENLLVRFEWIEDRSYFEFRITRDELTNDVSLIITDFAEPDEIEETKSVWDIQVATLKKVLGS
ncbi:MAG TPA: START-like domain-containing protein [Prolixibacteraceae bacterium]|nr:START-like domain-containing protein [Prolixibacteraceae bacterium]HPR60510.1 START-like domain-containing protein [Prolixibacteraceae bacterium]